MIDIDTIEIYAKQMDNEFAKRSKQRLSVFLQRSTLLTISLNQPEAISFVKPIPLSRWVEWNGGISV